METFSDLLFHAHSGVRYLVLVAGLLSFGYSLVAALRRRPWDRTGRILLVGFVGLIDLQVLLGLATLLTRPFYPMLWGHITLMALAAATAHIASRLNKRTPERQSHLTAALGAAGALILIVGGITAIGRPLF